MTTEQATPRLVCLLGAECTGKTTLAQNLAAHYGGIWVPEYLREFCDNKGRTPLQEEQPHIQEMQWAMEEAARQRAQEQPCAWVFCDTAPLLTAVYSETVFGDSSLLVRGRHLHQRYAITLLLQNDVQWVPDGLQRDGPHVRAQVQQCIERELRLAGQAFVPIAGTGPARLVAAMYAMEHAFSLCPSAIGQVHP